MRRNRAFNLVRAGANYVKRRDGGRACAILDRNTGQVVVADSPTELVEALMKLKKWSVK